MKVSIIIIVIVLLSTFLNGCVQQDYNKITDSPITIPTPTPTLSEPILNNPTWEQLREFLKVDNTDELTYTSTFECLDFAKTLQEHANGAGWRCAIVTIHLSGDQEIYVPSKDTVVKLHNLLQYSYHALNAFETTDRGLVYIDDTGMDEYSLGMIRARIDLNNAIIDINNSYSETPQPTMSYPSNFDKIVYAKIGGRYIPYPLFPNGIGTYLSIGIVDNIDLQW